MTEITNVPLKNIRPGLHRLPRVSGWRKIILVAGIGVLGLTTTVIEAASPTQEQLDTMQRQLEQQQSMMQKMQREFDEEKLAREEIKQQAADADTTAQEAKKDIETVAKAVGIDVSKETDRLNVTNSPTFKIPTTDTVMTISGFIRASAIHDFDNIASPYKFAARRIATDGSASGDPSERTTLTANTSRFILGTTTPTEAGKLTTLFSWDFAGNTTTDAADLRMRQAWGQLDDVLLGGSLRVGQSWSSWNDPGVLPETMDFQGPNGSQQLRQPLIRWAREYEKEYTLWLALEDPNYSVANGNAETRWPDAVAALNWHGDWGHIKPAIMGRDIRSNATADGSDDSDIGWGTQLSGIVNTPWLHEKDNFRFQVVYGSGIGSYNNDGGIDDAIFKANGDIQTIESFQGYGALQHWWTSGVRSNVVAGWVNVDNENEQADDVIDKTWYGAINLVWSPLKQMDVGIETLWGQRDDKDGSIGTAKRIQTTAKVSF